MNILNEAVSQLMSEFPGIFEQVDNLEENLNNNRVGNFNDNFTSNIQNGGNLDHFITQTKSVHNNKFSDLNKDQRKVIYDKCISKNIEFVKSGTRYVVVSITITKIRVETEPKSDLANELKNFESN
ncbi:unnamed protein product [Brachionus calyciflorus]|uniref:Uncharacterized protein n=1 Tax=Brachionus calyciflorus TaxID=104777 RepID=A0A814FYP5_9BILA|nr:unnamed protein product [Brachionus calyciflorus]